MNNIKYVLYIIILDTVALGGRGSSIDDGMDISKSEFEMCN